MNMFNLLDSLIKGTVQFLLDLIYSVGTLIAHPLTGAPRLYRDAQDRGKIQMSSVTFLALVLMIGGAIDDGNDGSGDPRAVDNTMGKIAGLLTTGTSPEGFGPVLAGAVTSVVLIALMLRGIARVARLQGRRRERFLAVMEYQVALFLLLLALVVFWNMFQPAELSDDAPPRQVGLLYLISALAPIVIFSLGAQFWIALTRSPRVHRLRRRLPRVRRRWTRRRGGAVRGQDGAKGALLMLALLAMIVSPLAAIPPVLLSLVGRQSGQAVSTWMFELDRTRKAEATAHGDEPATEAEKLDPTDVLDTNEQILQAFDDELGRE
jgi:hypothetical protein